MSSKVQLYFKLFITTFGISAFTFGGGYTIVPLLRKKFVDELHWINEDEMLNLTALAQSSPGAIAVNSAMLVGFHVAGLPGAVASIAGTVLPPFLIISIVSLFYVAFKSNHIVRAVLRGMQAGVVAVIVDTVISMGRNTVKSKSVFSIAVMVLAFVASYFIGVNLAFIILLCAVLGAVRMLIIKRKGGKAGL